MTDRGARNIVILSRSGAKKQEAKNLISALAERGVNIKAYACNFCDASQMLKTLDICHLELPPIRGVIQGAMVLQDSVFENMTGMDFMTAAKPKVEGSWNLHRLLPKDMDFFICLSSGAGIAGARGQSNYAAGMSNHSLVVVLTSATGNTYQDALAWHRRAQGLPAVTIDIGIVLSVGFVAENVGNW